MDLTSAAPAVRNSHVTSCLGYLRTLIELRLRILQDVPRNTGLVRALGDLRLQHIQQLRQILVPSLPPHFGLRVPTRPEPQQRDVVLPVVAGAAQIADLAFDEDDLAQHLVVDVALDADAVVERQAGVQRELLEVRVGIDIDGAVPAVAENLLDARVRFEVDDGHVRLHGRPVERRRGRLAASLARLVPRRRPDGEALRAGHDGVESMQGRPRDEAGLVGDPEVLHRVERVHEDDSLGIHDRGSQPCKGAGLSFNRLFTLLPSRT